MTVWVCAIDCVTVWLFVPLPQHSANRCSHYLYGHLTTDPTSVRWFPSDAACLSMQDLGRSSLFGAFVQHPRQLLSP